MINRIIALLYFFLTFPLLLFIFLLIFFIDRSNPVFNQIRVGRNEVPFKIYKFRTMINSNEKDYFKKDYKEIFRKQKIRETKIGQILRRLSLDELPQLINVINGSMNFVGPRPLLPNQIKAIPRKYRVRAKVLPGITGLAQVKGRRHLSWLNQLKYDEFYIKNQSVFLDIKIVLLTFKIVFLSEGVDPKGNKNWREYL